MHARQQLGSPDINNMEGAYFIFIFEEYPPQKNWESEWDDSITYPFNST